MRRTHFRAVTIDVEGDAQAVVWDASSGTLSALQEAVGGAVDVVSLHPRVDMWVNDNGIPEGLPINQVATTLTRLFGLSHQPYFGPVVFTGGVDGEGETLTLDEDQVETLLDFVRIAHQRLTV